VPFIYLFIDLYSSTTRGCVFASWQSRYDVVMCNFRQQLQADFHTYTFPSQSSVIR